MFINPKIREQIYARDKNQCLICGTHEDLSIDHIKPLSKGGINHWSNLQTLCVKCNGAKGTLNEDYREWLDIPFIITTNEEEKFNWQLSFEEIDEKYSSNYKQKRKKKKTKNQLSFTKPLNLVWDGRMPATHKEEMLKCQSGFVIHKGKKCLEYGKLNVKIGYGASAGQRVFYDNIEDKLILEYAGTIISYHYNTIAHLVTKNTYAPREYTKILPKAPKPKRIKTPKSYPFSELTTPKEYAVSNIIFDIEKWKKEPEPNFHYQD